MSRLTGTELPSLQKPLPGPEGARLCELLAEVECPAYTARRKRRAELSGAAHDPIVWREALGANVLDVDGNCYVDLVGGFGAALLGHRAPQLVAALQAQLTQLVHALGDVYPSERKLQLEAALVALSPFPDARVLLGISGSDAIEAALKTAMLYTRRPGLVAFEGAYHGLSYGALSACGYKLSFREPFLQQLNPRVSILPYPAQGDAVACEATLRAARALFAQEPPGALLLEPILGRGGVVLSDPETVQTLGNVCKAHDTVLIADEIYTGCWRTGEGFFFGPQHWKLVPDIVCLGKALGGALPVSACLMRPELAQAWGAPVGEALHTSTFVGNPLACAAALASLELLAQPSLQAQLRNTAQTLWAEALPKPSHWEKLGVRGCSGRGLLVGIALEGTVGRTLAVMRALLELGYLVLPGGVHGDRLTLTPPLCITHGQLLAFGAALAQVLAEHPAGAHG